MRRLIELYPEELDLWNDLGVKYLMMGSNEDARLAFQQVPAVFALLRRFPLVQRVISDRF
jgi:Flp pilus assembly protein TadD